MSKRTGIVVASGAVALALALSGCAGGGSTAGGGADKSKPVTLANCTPQNPLIASNTNETCGGNIISAITAGLVHYNPDTAAPELDVAKSIETKDNKTFTVTLNKGYKFSDGTEIKAKNFVDAWNWAAYGPNGQTNSYFFEPIEGYNDLQCGDKECKEAPKAKEMSGLKIVDDYTFTITTSEPVSNLKVRLGYTAFAPQPDAFFKDSSEGKKDFGKKPIAAGPYMIEKNDDLGTVVVKNPNYSGKFPASVDKIFFKVYNDQNAAYSDLVANNLDLDAAIPTDKLADDLYQKELPNRNGKKAVGVFQSVAFAGNDPKLKNPLIRKAISEAVDRDLIIKQVFQGSREAAHGWVAPVVDGYKADQCGEACVFNKEQAKKDLEAGGGYTGVLPLWINGDGGHDQWANAVCNQIKLNLGIDCQVQKTPDFKTLRNKIKKREIQGMFRTGWQMDYPSIENFLTPLYATGASSNDTDYSNKEFDAKLKAAAAATDPAEANKLYQEAEAMLAKDMPVMPTWFGTAIYGWSDRIASVKMTPFGTFDLGSIKLK